MGFHVYVYQYIFLTFLIGQESPVGIFVDTNKAKSSEYKRKTNRTKEYADNQRNT